MSTSTDWRLEGKIREGFPEEWYLTSVGGCVGAKEVEEVLVNADSTDRTPSYKQSHPNMGKQFVDCVTR